MSFLVLGLTLPSMSGSCHTCQGDARHQNQHKVGRTELLHREELMLTTDAKTLTCSHLSHFIYPVPDLGAAALSDVANQSLQG